MLINFTLTEVIGVLMNIALMEPMLLGSSCMWPQDALGDARQMMMLLLWGSSKYSCLSCYISSFGGGGSLLYVP